MNPFSGSLEIKEIKKRDDHLIRRGQARTAVTKEGFPHHFTPCIRRGPQCLAIV